MILNIHLEVRSDAEAIYISNLGLNDMADQKIRTAGSKVAQGKLASRMQ